MHSFRRSYCLSSGFLMLRRNSTLKIEIERKISKETGKQIKSKYSNIMGFPNQIKESQGQYKLIKVTSIACQHILVGRLCAKKNHFRQVDFLQIDNFNGKASNTQ